MKHLYKEFEISKLIYFEGGKKGPEGAVEASKKNPEAEDEDIILDDDSEASKKTVASGDKLIDSSDPMKEGMELRQRVVEWFKGAIKLWQFSSPEARLRQLNRALKIGGAIPLNKLKNSHYFKGLIDLNKEVNDRVASGAMDKNASSGDKIFIAKTGFEDDVYSLNFSISKGVFEIISDKVPKMVSLSDELREKRKKWNDNREARRKAGVDAKVDEILQAEAKDEPQTEPKTLRERMKARNLSREKEQARIRKLYEDMA